MTMVAPLRGLHTCARGSTNDSIRAGFRPAQPRSASTPGVKPLCTDPVLATRRSNGFNGRWSRRQWVHASLFADDRHAGRRHCPRIRTHCYKKPAMHATRHSMALTLPPLPMARLKGHNGDSWQIVRMDRGRPWARCSSNSICRPRRCIRSSTIRRQGYADPPQARHRTGVRPCRRTASCARSL